MLPRLVAGHLSEDELAQEESHLDTCSRCRKQLARLLRARALGNSSGRIIGERYRLVRKLGEGGMGAVYEARHLELGRRIAIKILHTQFAARGEILSRFKNEARILANLDHAAIVAAHDFGTTQEGEPFLVLDFLEGQTLRERLVHGALPIRDAIEFGREVAAALHVAHTAGVVHLDVKPENIFVTAQGQTKVLDFGVSRPMENGSGELGLEAIPADRIVGTMRYMAPEQIIAPDTVDARTDVYALGLLTFELLTGEHALEGDTKEQLTENIRLGITRNISQLLPSLPAAARSLIERALRPKPHDRFQSAHEFAVAAELALNDHLLPRLEERSLRPEADAEVSVFGFVGRKREQETLTHALNEAVDAKARLVAVVGASGLGKSSLLEQAAADAETAGWRTAFLRPDRTARKGGALSTLAVALGLDETSIVDEAKSWLMPFERSTLEKFLAARAATDEAAPLSGDSLRIASDQIAAGALTFTEILLDEASRASDGTLGMAIYVDDWLELDELSAAVLRQCVWRASERWTLCLVIATSNKESAASLSPNVTIELEAFTEEETRELVARFPTAPAGTAEDLHARSGGHPAFVAWTLLTLDRPTSDTSGDPLLRVVHSRLEALSAKTREACKTLSAWDGPFAAADLLQLGFLGVDEIWSELERERWIRLVGEDTAVFREPLARDLVYQLLRPSARQDLHLRMARLLSEVAVEHERVALHFEKAGQLEKATQMFRSAVNDGIAQGDFSLIVRAGDGVARLGRLQQLEASQLELYCAGLSFVGRLADEAAALDVLLQCALPKASEALALIASAVCAQRRGAADDALVRSTQAVTFAQTQSSRSTLARVYGRRAMILLYAGFPEDATTALDESAKLIGEGQLGLDAELAGWQGQLAAVLGRIEQQKIAYERMAILYEERGDVRSAAGASVNLADTLNRIGLYAQADRALSNAASRCRSVGATLMEAYAELNAGYSRTELGRYPRAHDALHRCQVLAERMQEQRLLTYVEIYRAYALWREGRVSEGLVAARSAQERVHINPRTEAHAWVLVALCAKDEDCKRALEAIEQAAVLRDRAQGLEEADSLYWLARGEVFQLAGDSTEAKSAWTRGRDSIEGVAGSIASTTLRTSYLATPIHRLLIARTGGTPTAAPQQAAL